MVFKKAWLFLCFLLLVPLVLGIQPVQQSNKIFLSPFYVNSMVQNVMYNYSVDVRTADGISEVKSAILTLDAWINPTRTFSAWMNGVQCNTQAYTISTTYASAGRGVVTFDCSNAIIPNAVNSVSFKVTGGNIGSSTAWLDLTYMNNPSGSAEIFGTEYLSGEQATIFLQLKDAQDLPENDGLCSLSVYYPYLVNSSHPVYLQDAPMLYKEGSQGLYYLDLVVPDYEGVYMLSASCSYEYAGGFIYSLGSEETNYPARTITYGTYTGSSIFLNDYEDWIYTKCTSQAVGGTKYCDAYYDFNTSVHFPDLNNVTSLSMFYMGEASAVVTATYYYWNWTNSLWVSLPNTLTYSGSAGSVPIGVGDFVSNSVPVSALNNNTGLVRLRISVSSGQTFSVFSNWFNVRVSTAQGVVEDLKGAGEIHVSDKIYDFLQEMYLNLSSLQSASLNYTNALIVQNSSGVLNALLLQHNFTQGLLYDLRQNMTGEFGITNNLILSEHSTTNGLVSAVNSSLISEFSSKFSLLNSSVYGWYQSLYGLVQSENALLSGLVTSAYQNLTSLVFGVSGQVSDLTDDVSDLSNDLSNHDSFVSGRFDDLEAKIDALELKLDVIMERLNVNLNAVNLEATTHDCLEGSVWSISVVAYDELENYLNSTYLSCNITTDLWATAPLVWDGDSFVYEHECGYGSDTITWVVDCEKI